MGTLTAIDLVIAGHRYQLAEVGVANEDAIHTAIGAMFFGAQTVRGDGLAHDFLILFDRVNPALLMFTYAVRDKVGALWWSPTQVEAHFEPASTVPEPGSFGLVAVAGLAMVGRARVSRRRFVSAPVAPVAPV